MSRTQLASIVISGITFCMLCAHARASQVFSPGAFDTLSDEFLGDQPALATSSLGNVIDSTGSSTFSVQPHGAAHFPSASSVFEASRTVLTDFLPTPPPSYPVDQLEAVLELVTEGAPGQLSSFEVRKRALVNGASTAGINSSFGAATAQLNVPFVVNSPDPAATVTLSVDLNSLGSATGDGSITQDYHVQVLDNLSPGSAPTVLENHTGVFSESPFGGFGEFSMNSMSLHEHFTRTPGQSPDDPISFQFSHQSDRVLQAGRTYSLFGEASAGRREPSPFGQPQHSLVLDQQPRSRSDLHTVARRARTVFRDPPPGSLLLVRRPWPKVCTVAVHGRHKG